MANAVIAYLRKSVNPGGTPQRMKEWLGAMLLMHAAAIVLPGIELTFLTVADIVLISATVLLVIISWYSKLPRYQMPLCWALYITGLLLHVIGAIWYHTGRADFVMVTSWGIAMFITERRYYINFSQFMYAVLALVLVLSASTVITMSEKVEYAPNTYWLVFVGLLTVVSNIYLLITDYKYGKQRLDYFERHFDKVNELSASLSRILMVDKPVDQAMWDVTQECVPLLGLSDFVIYLYRPDKKRLVQVAAYGDKRRTKGEIINPIELKPGRGIVGRVFETKEPILITDTTETDIYIMDDQYRLSELAVPMLIGDRVFGVLDSEHKQKGFYNHTHLQLFKVIAAFCSIKAAQEEIRIQHLDAEKSRLEVIKIKELEQFKNKFITNISHDLKTPLSLILGPANQIHKTSDNEFVKKQSMYIMKNTDHLMSMVEQLLQLNRIEQGITTLHRETFELKHVLDNIKTQYTQHTEDLEVVFEVNTSGNLLVTTDAFKLSQCIHNLLQNAFKYTDKGGRVSLTAERMPDGHIQIVVSDTGIGIELSEQDKIFDRFYKIDVNNHKGTGIGLSLVKEYVTQLDGKIDLLSAPGKGSVFTILLPQDLKNAKNAENYAQENQDNYEADDKNPLILIAEDHVELNDFISQSLQLHDFRCLRAYNGKEALGLIRQNMPDLVISDLMMPEMSGEELVGQVKGSDTLGHIPIIVLTAKNQVDNRIDLYQLGADNYLAKPFKMEELLAIVENTLRQRKNLTDKFFRTFMTGGGAGIRDTVSEEANAGTEIENKIVQACMSYVLSHLDDPDLNVNTLGAAIGLGRNKLQKELKSATSLTPVEFIRSIRLHEAYKLMQGEKRYNISEIAYMTGFSNLSYFSRSFKAQFGYAPSEVFTS